MIELWGGLKSSINSLVTLTSLLSFLLSLLIQLTNWKTGAKRTEQTIVISFTLVTWRLRYHNSDHRPDQIGQLQVERREAFVVSQSD